MHCSEISQIKNFSSIFDAYIEKKKIMINSIPILIVCAGVTQTSDDVHDACSAALLERRHLCLIYL